MIAFRLAWPAFAYSIEDDGEAKRTYSFVLTYLLFVCSWISLALGLLAPWLVRLLARGPGFHRASEAVALLAFASTIYAGYSVLAIGVGRAKRTQFNWIVSGAAAIVNIVMNVILIPRYGMMGAAVATVGAYVALFAGMAFNAHRVYPVAYQWRRVATLTAVAVGLTVLGRALHVPSGARDPPHARVPARAAAHGLLPAGRAAADTPARGVRAVTSRAMYSGLAPGHGSSRQPTHSRVRFTTRPRAPR